jgi:hypothetical protein
MYVYCMFIVCLMRYILRIYQFLVQWAVLEKTEKFDLIFHLKLGVIRGCIRKFSDWVDNEIYAYNNKHSLRSNTEGYGSRTH